MENEIEIRHYITEAGRDVFGDWLLGLSDRHARNRIAARIDRLAHGNFGDCKRLRHGLCELRIDWGPGYRVYYLMLGAVCVFLLCGGDKRKQSSDVERALMFLADFKQRTAIQ
jgi:putative addiction module killer protein